MKVILYMAVTANGLIAKEDDDTPWSDAVWDSYYKMARQFKAVVLGRRTYELMKRVGEFEKIGNPFTVIVTKKDFIPNSNFVIARSPKEALKILREKNFSKVLVGGGGTLNSSFMEENLIDEIFLDVEPLVFGKGIKLFSGGDFEARLELIKVKNISPNEIQLHYKVKR